MGICLPVLTCPSHSVIATGEEIWRSTAFVFVAGRVPDFVTKCDLNTVHCNGPYTRLCGYRKRNSHPWNGEHLIAASDNTLLSYPWTEAWLPTLIENVCEFIIAEIKGTGVCERSFFLVLFHQTAPNPPMQVQANLVLPTQTCPPVIFLQAEMEACTLSQYGFKSSLKNSLAKVLVYLHLQSISHDFAKQRMMTVIKYENS